VTYKKDLQYYKFCMYGFLKNLKFFEPFLFIYLLQNNLSFLQIGILYSIKVITINILEIPSGIVADVYGRRRGMIFSFLSYIISFILFYLALSYFSFIIAIILFAIGDAFRTGNHKAMIFHYLKLNDWQEYKVDYYGHTRSFSQIGSAVSAALAAIFVFVTGQIKLVFLITILPYIFELLLMLSYPKQLDGELKSIKDLSVKSKLKDVLLLMKQSIQNKLILKSTINLSLYSGFYKSIREYIQPLIKTLALSVPVFAYLNDEKRIALFIGIIYTLLYIVTSITARNSKRILKLFKHYYFLLNISIISGFIIGIIIGIFYNMEYFIVPVVLFLLYFIIENARKPTGIAYLSSMFDDKILSTALSFESQAQTLFAAIIAPTLGLLVDQFGIGNGLIVISVGMLLMSPIYFLKRKSY
jgi:MFS family permease